jgi:IS30 family transposase
MLGSNRSTAVLAVVERKCRFLKLEKLKKKTAKNTEEATLRALEGHKCLSITNDRGTEFADHKRVSKRLGVKIYFCHPYSSSERGTCENRIGVIRQYLPKGKDLKYLKTKTLKRIEHLLNNRPMKCLDWRTPYEVAYGKSVALCT